MNLSLLPTDNLYKFLALAGLALVGFAIVVYLKTARALIERLHTLDIEAKTALPVLAYLEWVVEQKATRPAMPFEERDELRKLHRDISIKHERQKVELQYATDLTAQLRWLGHATLVGVTLGLAVSALGFALWYTEVQRPTDFSVKAATSAVPSGAVGNPPTPTHAPATGAAPVAPSTP